MGLLSGRRPGESVADASARQQRDLWGISSVADLIPQRAPRKPGMPYVSPDTALRHSAVWACLRTRADLISTFPLNVFRRVAGVQFECPEPGVLTNPQGEALGNGSAGMIEWMYSTQFDLDRIGNTVGLITARDGYGLPSRIELKPATSAQVIIRENRVYKYRIDNTLYDPGDVWHEKAFTVPGLHVGLSPVAYAAWSIGQYLSVQDFATDWFTGGAVPRARLKNAARIMDEDEAAIVKEAWRASVAAAEPFVHGSDWEYDLIQAESASTDWLEAMKFSITDVCRFSGCPSDIIDSAPTGATRQMTYANITQRNLQLLIMNLGPAIIRREAALTSLTVQPRYVELNTDALLRLDPATRATAIKTAIDARTLAPSEARELENRQPFTDAQLEEFDWLFGVPEKGMIYAPEPGEDPLSKPPPAALPPADGEPELEPAPELPAIEGPGGG